MVRAVLFDFDGTLRENPYLSLDALFRFVKEWGWPVNDEDYRRTARWEHYYWAQSRELLQDLQNYDFDTPEFWRQYTARHLAALGVGRSLVPLMLDQAVTAMQEAYRYASRLPDDLLPALEALQTMGLQMGVFSNRRNGYEEELETLGLSRFFSFVLAAGDLQAWKPEPDGFRHALAQMGVSAGETVYVGDNYFADVLGARRAGLIPVLYNARGLYDDPDCLSIQAFHELPSLVKGLA